MQISYISLILVLISTVFAAFGSFFLKKASHEFKLNIKNLFHKELIMGIITYILSTFFFISALRISEVSILYPITALSYIWVNIISVCFLKEKINKYKFIGISFIILGVILITI